MSEPRSPAFPPTAGRHRRPFEDCSGGLIVFECESLDDGRGYVSSDPFVAHRLLHVSWLKQWSVEHLLVHG
jgi:hypothetical protein